MIGLKSIRCQYPGCEINLIDVHIATQFCLPHKILKKKQTGEAHHRETYKSKFHREHITGDVCKNPKPLPPGLKAGGPCPGNGNGFCGAMIRLERAMDTEGYSTPFFDYFCGTHRFPDPREEK